MEKIHFSVLRESVRRYLVELGTRDDIAINVAELLVNGDQSGQPSHGVMRLLEYDQKVRSGMIIPSAVPVIWRDSVLGRVDGNWGWGASTALEAVNLAKHISEELGAAVVTAVKCSHVGRLEPFGRCLGEAGLMGVLMASSEPNMAPVGTKRRLIGTNPLCMVVPSDPEPIILDAATAEAAEGKIRVLRSQGKKAETKCIIDSGGNPSDSPDDYYAGGALIPFGGHKGSGIAVMIDLLAGSVSSHSALDPRFERGNGLLVLAFDPSRFPNFDPYEIPKAADRLRGEAHSVPVVPGDFEISRRSESDMVNVPDSVMQLLEIQR